MNKLVFFILALFLVASLASRHSHHRDGNDGEDRNDNNNRYNSNEGDEGNDGENSSESTSYPSTSTGTTVTTPSTGTSSTTATNTAANTAAAATSTASSSTGKVSSFAQTCLDGHNVERQNLGIVALTWSTELAAAAQSWADTIAKKGALAHSENRVHIGENTARRTFKDYSSTPLLIGQWLDEKKYFKNGKYPNISNSGNVHDVGHYSQMVWALTTELGCGIARAGGRDYLVCQYGESGNRQGKQVY